MSLETGHFGNDRQLQSNNLIGIMENILENVNSSTEITAKIIGQSIKTPFIHISHDQWQKYSDIPFGPSFYLVLRVLKDDKNKESLQIQMATFSGRLLQSPLCEEKIEISENVGQNVIRSDIFLRFVRGDIRLCKGLLKSAKKNPGEEPDILREFIGDRIVTRSRQCNYAVLNTNLDSSQTCQNCKSFLPTTSSIKQQQSDSDTNIKSESEEMEDFDDYDTNEFLDNDDIQVVSCIMYISQNLDLCP